jgi:hypothetical protein
LEILGFELWALYLVTHALLLEPCPQPSLCLFKHKIRMFLLIRD